MYHNQPNSGTDNIVIDALGGGLAVLAQVEVGIIHLICEIQKRDQIVDRHGGPLGFTSGPLDLI